MKLKKLAIFGVTGLAVLGLAACTDDTPTDESIQTSPTTSTGETEQTTTTKEAGNKVEIDYLAEETEAGEYDITPVVIPGRTAGKVGAQYTYNVAAASLPTSWNVHTYQSNDATTILDYTEDVLYTFDYNQTLDGYRIVPAMAKSMPVDVTAESVGKFGIKEGSKALAYKIELRDDLKFADGKAIKASAFAKSLEYLMNPVAANYRADSYYSGNLKLVNAENYFKGGTYAYGEFVSENYGDEEYIYPEDFKYDTANGGIAYVEKNGERYDIALDIYSGGNWGSNSLLDYAQAGYLGDNPRTIAENGRVKYASEDGTIIVWRSGKAIDEEGNYDWFTTETGEEKTTITYDEEAGYMSGETVVAWANCIDPESSMGKLQAWADEDGMIKLDAEKLKFVQDSIAKLQGFENVEEYAAEAGDYAYVEFEEMAFLGKDYEEIPFEKVGFVADDANNTITIYLEKPLSGFYLNYALTTSFSLVDPDLYASCESTSQGAYTNTYATSVATYNSFGPYKLTQYVADSIIVMEKNENWYGYSLEENETNYWTTKVEIKQIKEDSARLEAFLLGQTDSYGLQEKDMDDYQTSKYTYFTDGDSTWFVALNPDLEGYATMEATTNPVTAGNRVDKEIMSLMEFRMALSFSLDRNAYALALDPLGGTAKALYGNMIISDAEKGIAYRTTEEAKDVILKFWGLEDEVGGEGLYATKDEAIASITGYDPAGAKTLFTSAYNKAVNAGYIDASDDMWEVQIMIGIPSSVDYYNNGFEFLKKTWTAAVVGTPLEGHLEFVKSQELGSTSFSSYLKDNTIDMLFGVGWTGSALDPYGLMEAYVSPNYQYDPAWNTEDTDLDIEIDGYVLRASVYDWGALALNGSEIKANVVVNGEKTNDYAILDAGTSCKADIRLKVLAAVEGAVLEQYDMIPINLDSSANLKGMQIKYGTEEYIFGMGRGGVKYMTYNYTDAEWAEFVSSQGGKLNYKVSE